MISKRLSNLTKHAYAQKFHLLLMVFSIGYLSQIENQICKSYLVSCLLKGMNSFLVFCAYRILNYFSCAFSSHRNEIPACYLLLNLILLHSMQNQGFPSAFCKLLLYSSCMFLLQFCSRILEFESSNLNIFYKLRDRIFGNVIND